MGHVRDVLCGGGSRRLCDRDTVSRSVPNTTLGNSREASQKEDIPSRRLTYLIQVGQHVAFLSYPSSAGEPPPRCRFS